MLVAVIILSWFLAMSLIAVIIFGAEDGFTAKDWLAVALFIFALPIYLLIKAIITIKRAVDRKKRHKKLKQLLEKKTN